MVTQIDLGDVLVDVTLKNIKNIHLSVHPPTGQIRVAAPIRMNLETIRAFAITKLGWIRQQQRKLQMQAREAPREYVNRESHYLWGKRYLLTVVEGDRPSSVDVRYNQLVLQIKKGAAEGNKRTVIAAWYREQLKEEVSILITSWAPVIGITIRTFYVQRMKTKWGSCNQIQRSVRFNTELAKKPKECLEYIVVHELTHLLEPTHNARFISMMDRFMPNWRLRRDQLNELPVCHEKWTVDLLQPAQGGSAASP